MSSAAPAAPAKPAKHGEAVEGASAQEGAGAGAGAAAQPTTTTTWTTCSATTTRTRSRRRWTKISKLKAAAEARLAKKEAAQKSMVVIEVKPWEADQDLNALWKKIVTEMTFEGLKWGEACQLVGVAFGIKRCVSCVIKMDVSMDDVTEAIQGLEDEVRRSTSSP